MNAGDRVGLPAAPAVGALPAFAPDFLGRVPGWERRPASLRFEWTRRPGLGPGVSVLGDLKGRTVVELGCGVGYNLSHLAAVLGACCVGIDHDAATVRLARAMFGHLGISFVHADAAEYLRSVPAESVDVCVSVFGAFSFGEPAALLRAAAVALRPGGRLGLTLRVDDGHDRVIVLERKEVVSGGDG